jgi:predicted NAD/FAD-binding protein
MNRFGTDHPRRKIAVVGTGISGMAAAWLLSQHHRVTVYEKDDRIGGHTNTVTLDGPGGQVNVDTGFIVYNERNYPNLVALFDHLGVATQATDMSFAASLDKGRFEYSGEGVSGLLAQPVNVLRPRLWRMLGDLLRFYREAPNALSDPGAADLTLGAYLEAHGYGEPFVRDHLLPMGAAIWSTPTRGMLDYPLAVFVRFCDNHGLLSLGERPQWRTVVGGSRAYLERLTEPFRSRIQLNTAATAIYRGQGGVRIEDRQGGTRDFDDVVIASHADQALALLADADPAERRLLGAFRYERNLAVLHSDLSLMPRARRAWAAWNFLSEGRGDEQRVCVTYWMNRLQRLPDDLPLFVTLNPTRSPAEGTIHRTFLYQHPVYDRDAVRAQGLLWNLQGARRTWFCGSYFGHGFHEDGLQAGLAVAEQLGGVARPWQVADPNGRIHCYPRQGQESPTRSAVRPLGAEAA